MVSSLSSTGAISFLSSLSSISDKPTSPSNVSVQKIPSLCFSHRISTRFLTRPRLASRLGPTEDVAASETPKSADWDTARSYKEKGLIFETKIEGFNAGGLLMKFQSLMAFLPYTLLNQARFCKDSPRPILERAKDLVGSSISVKVQDVKEQSRTIILSEKAAIWEKYSDQVEVGAIFKGIISSIEEYGAFVYLLFPDGLYSLSGMIHISEASWDLVPDMRDLVTEGDEIKVKVIEIDREKKKINLSLRQLEDDPLYTTLDKVILETNDTSDDYDAKMEPLPGLDNICQELLNEDGITDVQLGRQGFEKRVVSQDLELWLSNAPVKDNQVALLARAGRQVQEVYLTTTLDQDGIKKAVQHILERVL